MTLMEELLTAARGCVALLLGQRDAPRYFDFSYRGLAGSFIALLAALTVNAYLPVMLGLAAPESSAPSQDIFTFLVVLAAQLAFAWWFLRQLGRLDGFVPYLVASNWSALFITLISLVIALSGLAAAPAVLLVGIAVIIVEVNIGRLIVTLSIWQIVGLLVVQAVGGLLGLLLIGAVLTAPEAAASSAAAAASAVFSS